MANTGKRLKACPDLFQEVAAHVQILARAPGTLQKHGGKTNSRVDTDYSQLLLTSNFLAARGCSIANANQYDILSTCVRSVHQLRSGQNVTSHKPGKPPPPPPQHDNIEMSPAREIPTEEA